MKEYECLLCLRIPYAQILEHAMKLYDEEEVAAKIAEEAAKILKKGYLLDPPELCGKSPRALMGGALYLAGRQNKLKVPQKWVAAVVGVTEVTIRKRYLHLANLMGLKRASALMPRK